MNLDELSPFERAGKEHIDAWGQMNDLAKEEYRAFWNAALEAAAQWFLSTQAFKPDWKEETTERVVTELKEPAAMTQILTPEQVTSIRKDALASRSSTLPYNLQIVEDLCDTIEALRARLHEVDAEAERYHAVVKHVADTSLINGMCIWCGMEEGEDHGTNYNKPCAAGMALAALATQKSEGR